jgi:hypothetical protein
MGGIECHWWKFWRRLRALTQLPRPVALAGGFEVPTGGSALIMHPLHFKSSGRLVTRSVNTPSSSTYSAAITPWCLC